jgi:hypothetical protein
MQCHVQVSQWLGVLAPEGRRDLDPLLSNQGSELVQLLKMVYSIDFSVEIRGGLDPKQLLTSDGKSVFAGAPFAFLFALFKMFGPKFAKQTRGVDSQPAASVCARMRMRVPMRGSPPRTHAHACASLRCVLPLPPGATA